MRSRIVWLLLWLLMGISDARNTRAEPPRTLPIDENAVAWHQNKASMLRGWELAEKFRTSLADNKDRAGLESIGALLELFRTQYQVPIADRPSLANFGVTQEKFVAQLKGHQLIDTDLAFEPFSGRWYGLWENKKVNHHWHNTKLVSIAGADSLVSAQFAWIGDGFGWNYLNNGLEPGDGVVTGYVYHLEENDPAQVRFEFPLIGYFDGPGRLIWITPAAIFFEEVLPAKKKVDERYAITGFLYKVENGQLRNVTDGFQAVYIRDDSERPLFADFKVNLSIEVK